ncbi:MAG: cysteine--tRNA ligase [Candidatus Kaiserbacteria bacterium]|nr:cysteine--tRNA ligase [Candidatus Kaiserbacteria bacterium]MCB9816082.1 cysteine--tRNA ligase [Candidatus Nomurabacteria bacterium]
MRDITLYNTESGEPEIFVPLSDKEVKMYSCGPTVYDYAHVGNLRSYVFADILKRVLIRNGYIVKHTINFTDFGHLTDDGDAGEDKMMKGLKREGLPVTLDAMRQLSDRYIKAFKDDFDELRIMPPDTWARASEYVNKQISLIKTLDEKGFTYETSDGLYFDISKFPTYGRLGKINLKKLKSGARVEVNTEKKHPADFAVWKKSELGWDSKWGKGFPGWHVECSAMAMDTLGKQIDIHTGGIDHIPVHHNAEICQSEAATGKQFVKYWMHNAFITIDSTKIAKSLGNSITMRHLRDRGFSGDDYRYWLLTAHYRSPANFSWEALKAAKQALFRLKRYVYEEFKQKTATPDQTYLDRFDTCLANDLDTPGAIATLWDMVNDKKLDAKVKCGTLMSMDEVLDIGLSDDLYDGQRSLGVVAHDDLPEKIQALIDEREAARIARNWEMADALRDKLKLEGYELEDTPLGPKVTKV